MYFHLGFGLCVPYDTFFSIYVSLVHALIHFISHTGDSGSDEPLATNSDNSGSRGGSSALPRFR